MRIDQPDAGPGADYGHDYDPVGSAGTTVTTPPGAPPGTDRRRRRTLIGAVTAAVVLAAGGGYALLAPTSAYQEVNTTGSNPFTAPVGQDVVDIQPVAAEGQQRTGDTGGLYAADPTAPYCDIDALVSQLQSDPAKAAAWAQVLGIAPDGISPFAKSLSPVALRADTAVLDHGYSGGTYVSTPTVLQAGTSVLVNSYGEPTVKCMSGNPLTRPVAADGGSSGGGSGGGPNGAAPVAAPALDAVATSATVILPAPRQIPRLEIVNPKTGTTANIPGKPDPKPKPGPNPTPKPTETKPGTGTKPPVAVKPTPVFAHDGFVITPPDAQGRAFLLDPDGKISKTFSLLPGTKLNPNGTFTYPDGSIHSTNGAALAPVVFPDGRVLQPNGTVLPPLPAGESIRWTDNGRVIRVQPDGKIIQFSVTDGKPQNPKELPTFKDAVRQPDGSWRFNDGTILNPDGSIRNSVVIPGGDVLLNTGGYFPKEAAKPGDPKVAGEVKKAELAAPVDPAAPGKEPVDPDAALAGQLPGEENGEQPLPGEEGAAEQVPGEEGAGQEGAGQEGAGQEGAGQEGAEQQPGEEGGEQQPGGEGNEGGDGQPGEQGGVEQPAAGAGQ